MPLFIFLLKLSFSWDVFAASKCQKILGKNTALWEYEVYKFKEIGQLKVSIALFLTQFLYVVYRHISEILSVGFQTTAVK